MPVQTKPEILLRDVDLSHSIQIQINVPARNEGRLGAKVSYCSGLRTGVSCDASHFKWALQSPRSVQNAVGASYEKQP